MVWRHFETSTVKWSMLKNSGKLLVIFMHMFTFDSSLEQGLNFVSWLVCRSMFWWVTFHTWADTQHASWPCNQILLSHPHLFNLQGQLLITLNQPHTMSIGTCLSTQTWCIVKWTLTKFIAWFFYHALSTLSYKLTYYMQIKRGCTNYSSICWTSGNFWCHLCASWAFNGHNNLQKKKTSSK